MKTFILAITGPTNAGKSYFTEKLEKYAFQKGVKTISISTDEFYRDLSHLTLNKRNKVNYDHPDSIDSEEFIDACKKISEGNEIDIPIYDFSVHNRKETKRTIEKIDLLIVEGIFTLAFPKANKFYSLRIYIDMDNDVRVIRRIQRDMENRGRTLDSVITQYMETVKPTQQDFVQRDIEKVDIILKGDKDHQIIREMIVALILENK
ncbi:MAG: Uridine kinase [Candidatus Heimdallarchaeota archaeon LC_2]|nr:MAG: Uridine kinase [Candidatus Heimdallarchaeota archaeon LC_2]